MPHQAVTNGSPLSRIGKSLQSGFLEKAITGASAAAQGVDASTIRLRRGQVDLQQQELEANQAATGRADRQQALTNEAFGGGPDSDQAAAILAFEFPEVFEQISESMGLRTQGQKTEAADFALRLQATPFDERQALINQRVTELAAVGRDPQHTASLTGLSEEDQNNALRVTGLIALTPEQRASGARAAGTSKLGQSIVTKDPETGALSFATPVLDPAGVVTTRTTPIGGEVVSRTTGETGGERQVRDIETAGGRATAVSVSKRDQDFINVGQRQADATAVIRRGLELLEVMETGRPEQIALAARNLFGIAGADETELNANLGKAVLSQLRSTFGAQFTQQEGERLQSIEADFGKSTAGNIRLLQQTLRGMERDARRGVDAARRNEDEFSAAEIESALEFTLTPPDDTLDPALLELMSPEERALFEQ